MNGTTYIKGVGTNEKSMYSIFYVMYGFDDI